MGTTRRRFLSYGLGGVVLLLAPALGLSLRKSVLVEPRGPLLCLSPRQFSTLVALAETLCPGGDGLPTAASLGVADELDLLWSRMHPGVGSDLGSALDLLENALAGAVLDQRFQTFTACSAEVRRAVLLDWANSSIKVRRAVYKALRGFVMAAYWGNPQTWQRIGYDGITDYSAVPSPVRFDEFIKHKEAAAHEATPSAPSAPQDPQ